MSDVATLDNELNRMILDGKALEAFEKYYADNVVMQENSDPPIEGKDANRAREQEFFQSVEDFHGAELLSSAVNGDASLGEWVWEVTLRDVGRVKVEQVSARRWSNGQVVRERFYYNKG